MDSIDTTEQVLLVRLERRRRQLRVAEDSLRVANAGLRWAEAELDIYRRDREIERQVASDHELALTLQGTENQGQRLQIVDDDDDNDSLSETDDENEGHNDPVQGTCVTCLDELSDHDSHRSPCGHDWCRTCISNRYEMAAKSTHLFPAQCCNRLILPDNDSLVAPETWARYFEKKIEVETPNPTFCSKRDCSKFIPLQDITGGQGKCVCGQLTCAECKAVWHAGECVVDPEREQVLSLAREQQWQICFHCKVVVERLDGCNEMGTSNMLPRIKCVCFEASTDGFLQDCKNCNATFCYACGKKWKTCPCPQFGRAESPDQPPPRPTPGIHMEIHDGTWLDREQMNIGRRQAAAAAPRAVERVEPEATDATVDATVDDAAVDDATPAVAATVERRAHVRAQPWRPMRQTVRERRLGRATPTNAGCDEHNWRRIGGGGTCQDCNTSLPDFLFRCRTCGHTSCRLCR